MIIAYINNSPAYPAIQSGVKVNLENPYFKASGEKSMEIVFPMDIPENRAVFGPLNRLDTSFLSEKIENCLLLADNIEVIRGTGVITSVNDKEIKLQIISGKSAAKYKAGEDNVFIDKLDYGKLEARHEVLSSMVGTVSQLDFTQELASQGFIGSPGKYAFFPVVDETNDETWNALHFFSKDGGDEQNAVCLSWYRSIQPNLMHVLAVVMEALGYKVTENRYNIAPWDKLYICSAKRNVYMAKALPHWTAGKFLDEFRKLFNATYLFDDKNGTVRIVPFKDADRSDVCVCEPADEFSTSYNEEGVEYLGSSNLEYDLSGCEREIDCISQDVIKNFDYLECSETEIGSTFNSLTTKQKLTTIIRTPFDYIIGIQKIDDDGNLEYVSMRHCGWHSPLVRQEGRNTVTMKICPVAAKWSEMNVWAGGLLNITGSSTLKMIHFWGLQTKYKCYCLVPHMEGEELSESTSESQVDYTTVEDVLMEGASLPSKDSDDTIMELFFASGNRYEAELERLESFGLQIYERDKASIPLGFTDPSEMGGFLPSWSLAINDWKNRDCIGKFHNGGIKIHDTVDGNNEVCIKFLYDGKPNPERVYQFRNKLYVCSKIEMTVNESGIDRMKTGYFFEIL